jgi:hypothetical protein
MAMERLTRFAGVLVVISLLTIAGTVLFEAITTVSKLANYILAIATLVWLLASLMMIPRVVAIRRSESQKESSASRYSSQKARMSLVAVAGSVGWMILVASILGTSSRLGMLLTFVPALLGFAGTIILFEASRINYWSRTLKRWRGGNSG